MKQQYKFAQVVAGPLGFEPRFSGSGGLRAKAKLGALILTGLRALF